MAFDLALSAYVPDNSRPLTLYSTSCLFSLAVFYSAHWQVFLLSMWKPWLIRIGDDEPLIIMRIQLLTPLLVYFLAEELALSSILAVVAEGLPKALSVIACG